MQATASSYGKAARLTQSSLAAEAGARSAVCAAIAGGAGVFVAYGREAREFAGHEVAFVRGIANVLGARWSSAGPPLSLVSPTA